MWLSLVIMSCSFKFMHFCVSIGTFSCLIRSKLRFWSPETVLDSIDAGDFGEMCLHRKIAPYQCVVYSLCQGIFCRLIHWFFSRIKMSVLIFTFGSDLSTSDDLKDLAKYVSMLLQRSNISLLGANDCYFIDDVPLQQKFTEMDAIGVPYGILLDSDSLKMGFMKLRNRDTSLSETIHISYLTEYLSKIFQS